MKKLKYFGLVVITTLSLGSCSDERLEPTLDNEVLTENAVKTVDDIRLITDGMYKRMRATAYYGRDVIIFDEVRSDNTFSSGSSGRFVTVGAMSLTNNDAYATDTYLAIYQAIANANIVANSDVTGDLATINHIKGEALAARALAHFDLLKIFGQQHVAGQGGLNALGVSYIDKYKDLSNLMVPRSTVAVVKSRIYADFDAALALMDPSLNDSEKIRLTTHAVNALKSRVAIYFGDWAIAKSACEAVINSGSFSIVTSTNYASSFGLAGTAPNRIFELKSLSNDSNGINGLANIYRGTSYGDINVLQDLKNIFDSNDVRGKTTMINTVSGKLRNVGKYPTGGTFHDNIKIIRYEEVVLNYAEALFRLNASDPLALTTLNSIPNNRAAVTYSSVTEDNILLERRKELCFEGFRFSDLARTGKNIPLVSNLQQTHGGVTYGNYKYAFPIPIRAVRSNTSLIQNSGY